MANTEKKVVGTCKVFSADAYTRRDGSYGFKCIGITEDGTIVQFYRPGDEDPHKDDVYDMYIATDKELKPVVRMQKRV